MSCVDHRERNKLLKAFRYYEHIVDGPSLGVNLEAVFLYHCLGIALPEDRERYKTPLPNDRWLLVIDLLISRILRRSQISSPCSWRKNKPLSIQKQEKTDSNNALV